MSPSVNALLEREAPLAQLNALARRVSRGGLGEVVLLRGEAGVGKTAMLARFGDQLNSGLRVLRGWCDPLVAPRPLGPLIDALAGLDTDAAAALAGAVDSGDTARIYRQLLYALADGARWVWVIEDAHWADGATLDLVRFLARRIGALRLLLVITFRDDELAPAHPLAVTLGDLANCAAVTRIGLARLTSPAVATLAVGSGVNADLLYDITGGNPFFRQGPPGCARCRGLRTARRRGLAGEDVSRSPTRVERMSRCRDPDCPRGFDRVSPRTGAPGNAGADSRL